VPVFTQAQVTALNWKLSQQFNLAGIGGWLPGSHVQVAGLNVPFT
jgi:hypothetical protein